MLAIVGIVVVLGSIIAGYLLEHGNLLVLFQPAELVIIGGAAVGTVLIANPLTTVKRIFSGLLGIVKGSRYTKEFYLDQLKMLNDIFIYLRKNGTQQLELDIEEPHKSKLFAKFPDFLADHEALSFFCDTVRLNITGGIDTMELDQLMEMDVELHEHELAEPVTALQTVADSLPGLGIVAAVLGVVITMGALGGPPEEIGHKVASALVGTFLGILLCYGIVAPLAAAIAKRNEAASQYYNMLRVGLLSMMRGNAPLIAVEFARRAIPSHVRPSFKEMEAYCKGAPAASSTAAAA
ncbi:MAG: flagellar motor stator protein MotA [Bryobacteraceae bacterium]|nr:flagellar motor stator protein MotA [Bryobacteraceae bacterium]